MAWIRSSLRSTAVVLCCLVTLPVVLGRTEPAMAQPRPVDKQKAAKQYVEAGLAAQNSGDYATALTLFGKAYELVPHPVLLFNIGQVHRLAGRPAQAIDFYKRYLAAEPKGAQAKTAQELITALEVQLATAEPAQPDPEQVRLAEEAARAKAEAEAARAEAAAFKAQADANAQAAQEAEAARQAEVARAAEQARADEAARQASNLALSTPPPPPPPPPRKGKPRALMLGLAAVAVVAGVVIDTVPDSSSNGSLDALDFAPVVLYPLSAGLIVGSF